jgi:chromosome segregation ATPase
MNVLYQHIDDLVKQVAGLTQNLEAAKTEMGRLKCTIEGMESEYLALTEKLADAGNEIARLDMLKKRLQDDSATIRRLNKHNGF